jgi:hypothetical protein
MLFGDAKKMKLKIEYPYWMDVKRGICIRNK